MNGSENIYKNHFVPKITVFVYLQLILLSQNFEFQDDILSQHFRYSLQMLSASASGQMEPNLDEFVVAEKIKKFLVSFFFFLLDHLALKWEIVDMHSGIANFTSNVRYMISCGEDLAIVSATKTPDVRSYSLDENKLVSCAHALPVLAGKIFFAFFQWALMFDCDLKYEF